MGISIGVVGTLILVMVILLLVLWRLHCLQRASLKPPAARTV